MELTILGVYAIVMTALVLGLVIALVRAYGGNSERLREGFELGKQVFTYEQLMQYIDALDRRWKSDDKAWNDGLGDVLRNAGGLVYGKDTTTEVAPFQDSVDGTDAG